MIKLMGLMFCIVLAAGIGLLPVGVFAADNSNAPCAENEIRLNTKIPFIGQCIKKTANPDPNEPTSGNAFTLLLGGMMKVVMTAVLVIGFFAILVAGVMMSMGGVNSGLVSKGKTLIISVIIGLLLLGASGIILNLINPNFFKTDSSPGLLFWSHTKIF